MACLLADFFDDEAWLAQANELLDNPTKARQLGDSGVDCVQQKYALKVCLPQLHQLYQETASLKRPG